MIQTTIAAVLATVAVVTYVTKVRDDQRALACQVYVEEQHLGIDDRSLEARIFNDGSAPIRFVGVGAFAASRRRRLWRFRRSQQDWWTGERFAGRFFPLIKAGGSPKVD